MIFKEKRSVKKFLRVVTTKRVVSRREVLKKKMCMAM